MFSRMKITSLLFTAFVTGVCSVNANSSELEVIKKDYGAGMAYEIELVNRGDNIRIETVEVNRGCDTPAQFREPRTVKFGERVNLGMVRCDPIEVTMTTDLGNQLFQWDAFTDAGVSVSIEAYMLPLWKVYVTNRKDYLEIKKVTINRGNCQRNTSVADYTSIAKNGLMNFGGRLLFVANCEPIEIEVTTSEGVGTFLFR